MKKDKKIRKETQKNLSKEELNKVKGGVPAARAPVIGEVSRGYGDEVSRKTR